MLALLRLFGPQRPVELLGSSASHDSSAFQGAGDTSLAALLRHWALLCSCSCFAHVSTFAPTLVYGPMRPWRLLRGITITVGLVNVDRFVSSS
jgi:hypothetical protein